MSWPRRAGSVALVAAFLLASRRDARAQAAPKAEPGAGEATRDRAGVVLIVRTPGDDRVVTRLRGELAASGWQSVDLTPDPRESDTSLARLSSVVSAAAAVRVHAQAGSIEVWVADPTGAPSAPAETISVGARPDDRVLVLRATEALRARGLRLERHAHDESPPEAPPPPAPPVPVAPRPPAPAHDAGVLPADQPPSRGIWVTLAPAATMSPGGTGPTFGAAASVAYERPFWSAGAIGAVPLTDSQISGPEGSAHVSTLFSGAFGELALVRGTFRANAGLGLAAAMTKMRGAAAAGYAGFDETIFVTAPFARFSAKLELGSAWRLGLVTMLGTALPHVSVRFADREVATWGRPYFLVATLGIEAPLLVR